jgi:hypothetical protein
MAERKRGWLQLPAIFWAGVLLVVVIPVLYFWLSVPHDALVQTFIEFPRMNFAGRHLPLPGPESLLGWRDFYLPLAFMAAATIALPQAAAARRPTLLLLVLTSASTLTLATQRLDPQHAYPAIMFSLVLLCPCIAVWQPEKQKFLPNLMLAGAIFFYGLCSLIMWNWQLTEPGDHLRDVIAAAQVRYSKNKPPNEIARAGPILLAFDQRQAIVYIQRHLASGKPLYVGVAIHALGWMNDALFYFLADRPQATRFDMFAPNLTTGAAVQSQILRDIRQNQTEYVVLFWPPRSHQPNLSSVDGGVRILDDAIRRDYIEVAEFGRYTIWHRRD